jgi:lincosamide nucleotidyltransferase A/C/D/E
MQSHDVLHIITWLATSSIPVWLDGGWGVDALLGRQTRPHDDLDVILALQQAEPVQHILGAHQFERVVDELPTRFVLRDTHDRRIDVHTVTFDAEGGGVQQLQDGRVFRYPPEGFTGIGSINGHHVRCLTAAVQLLCHTGYVPDENDIHDVHLIHTHFGLPLPPGYEP